MKKIVCLSMIFAVCSINAMRLDDNPHATFFGNHASTAAALGFVQQLVIMYPCTTNHVDPSLQGLWSVLAFNIEAKSMRTGLPQCAFQLGTLLGAAAGILLAKNYGVFEQVLELLNLR